MPADGARGSIDGPRCGEGVLAGWLAAVATVAVCMATVLFYQPAAAAASDLAEAQELLLRGAYEKAIEAFAAVDADNPRALIGHARALAAVGRDREAIDLLARRVGVTARAAGANSPPVAVPPGQDVPGSESGPRQAGEVATDAPLRLPAELPPGTPAAVPAELSRLLFERGDYRDAERAVDLALAADPDSPLARWILGELHREAGRLDEAEDQYVRLVRLYNSGRRDDPDQLRWIGLAAARHARWNRLSGQIHFLVSDLYPAALEAEPAYWPAHYEMGRLLLEKFNAPEARREIESALKINPRSAKSLALKAELALTKHQMQAAEEAVEAALEINPRLQTAWLLKADLAWRDFRPRDALNILRDKALPLNPRSQATLGRMAACHALLAGHGEPGHREALGELIAEVNRRNPRAGEFYFVLADALLGRHRHAMATRFHEEAIRRMPQLPGPHASMGLLQMALGREEMAEQTLREAFEADPFNLRVHNMLGVLEVLDEMESLETEHFIIRYLPGDDALLARYAARYLERNYPAWCRQFDFTPSGKTKVEIFSTTRGESGAGWFAARMTGLPVLDAAAASTGWIVAMASPNERYPQPFNWAQVLRHEVVHVITLQQTRFNMPHWLTEGLAVYLEGYPRPAAWNELLIDRVGGDGLFDLSSLNFAFMRPESSDDWQMAYCQAELYVEYVLQRFGSGALRQLIAAYAAGRATDQAIPLAVGVPLKQFEEGYRRYVEQCVAGVSRLERPRSGSVSDLRAAHRADPDDADVSAALAKAYLQRAMNDEARQLSENVLEKHSRHQLASWVLARLAMNEKDIAKAERILETAVDREEPQPDALLLLAVIKLKQEELAEAEQLFALGHEKDSISDEWLDGLIRTYEAAENDEKLTDALRQMAARDPDRLNVREKLTKIARQRRDPVAVLRWATEVLRISVAHPVAHRAMGEALLMLPADTPIPTAGAELSGGGESADSPEAVRQARLQRAIEHFETAVQLEPTEPHGRFALADAYLQAERPADAVKALRDLLELAPDYPGAELLLENIDEKRDE